MRECVQHVHIYVQLYTDIIIAYIHEYASKIQLDKARELRRIIYILNDSVRYVCVAAEWPDSGSYLASYISVCNGTKVIAFRH
jgi:hypothetical protein